MPVRAGEKTQGSSNVDEPKGAGWDQAGKLATERVKEQHCLGDRGVFSLLITLIIRNKRESAF